MTTPTPTPRSAEAVAREVCQRLHLAPHYAPGIAAALTAHATAAVAAERERCALVAATYNGGNWIAAAIRTPAGPEASAP